MSTDSPPDVVAELGRSLDSIEATFRARFGLDIEYPPEVDVEDSNRERFENRLAQVLLRDVSTMVASPKLLQWRNKLGDFPVGQLAAFLATRQLARPQIYLNLAREDIGSLNQRVERTTELLALLLEFQPTHRASAYLGRVVSCYVYGLDAECIVMCRAVLDSAFDHAVTSAKVRSVLPARRTEKGIHLAQRIDAADLIGVISKSEASVARAIKDSGNHAVHSVPLATLTPLEAIRGTMAVLSSLQA